MRVSLTVIKNDTPVTSKRVRPKTSPRSSVYPKRNLDLDSSVAKEKWLHIKKTAPCGFLQSCYLQSENSPNSQVSDA
jgi:hypothetical protein